MRTLRKVFLCLALLCGSLLGVPMRSDEIERVLRLSSMTKIVQVVEKDDP